MIRLPGLTERQSEVARLVAEGLTDEQIGARLGISTRRVNAHVHRLVALLNLDPARDVRVQITHRIGRIAA